MLSHCLLASATHIDCASVATSALTHYVTSDGAYRRWCTSVPRFPAYTVVRVRMIIVTDASTAFRVKRALLGGPADLYESGGSEDHLEAALVGGRFTSKKAHTFKCLRIVTKLAYKLSVNKHERTQHPSYPIATEHGEIRC